MESSPPRKRRKKVLDENLQSRDSTFLHRLPMDVLMIVHKSLGLTELRNCALTCRIWREVIGNFWKRQIFMHFSRHKPTSLTVDFIATHCPSLRSLKMENCQNVIYENLIALSKISALESLVLGHYVLASDEFKVFANLKNLVSLKLMDCKSSKPIDLEPKPRHGIENLASLAKLSNLELQYQMCDADLVEICSCSSLTALTLKGSDRISNIGVERLSNLQKLQSFSLKKKSLVSDEGLQSICLVTSLRGLSMWGGTITDKAIFSVAEKLRKLQYLCLGSSFLTDNAIDIISASLPSLAAVSFFSFKFSDKILNYLARIQLVSLELWFCVGLTDAGMNTLTSMSKLSSLNIGHCSRLTSAALDPISKVNSLYSLNAIGVDLMDLTPISRMSGLQSLSLGCKTLNDSSLNVLTSMPKLHSLYLWSCSVTNATFRNLSTMRLRHLEIESCQGITEEGVRALKNCNSLVRVALTSCLQIPPVSEFKKFGFHFNLLIR